MSTNKKNSKSSNKKKSILPKLDDNIHLSNYGYSLKNNKEKRKVSLKKASKDAGSVLPILKRTVLIANYSKSNQKNHDKLINDINFLKSEYKKEKNKSKKN